MNQVDKVRSIVEGFEFKKGDYLGAEDQLSRFAEDYAQLSVDEADALRCSFDAKERLGWLGVACSLIRHSFSEADISRKAKLTRIFLALYSFDNLELGYDTLLNVRDIKSKFVGHESLIKESWKIYAKLTRAKARDIEGIIFCAERPFI